MTWRGRLPGGVLTGLIAIGGLLLYLETRQRGRQLAYVMSRRMGLTRRQHWLSLMTEIGATFSVALTGGVALSGLAAWLIHPHLDPVRSLPPSPLFDLVGYTNAFMQLFGTRARVRRAGRAVGLGPADPCY